MKTFINKSATVSMSRKEIKKLNKTHFIISDESVRYLFNPWNIATQMQGYSSQYFNNPELLFESDVYAGYRDMHKPLFDLAELHKSKSIDERLEIIWKQLVVLAMLPVSFSWKPDFRTAPQVTTDKDLLAFHKKHLEARENNAFVQFAKMVRFNINKLDDIELDLYKRLVYLTKGDRTPPLAAVVLPVCRKLHLNHSNDDSSIQEANIKDAIKYIFKKTEKLGFKTYKELVVDDDYEISENTQYLISRTSKNKISMIDERKLEYGRTVLPSVIPTKPVGFLNRKQLNVEPQRVDLKGLVSHLTNQPISIREPKFFDKVFKYEDVVSDLIKKNDNRIRSSKGEWVSTSNLHKLARRLVPQLKEDYNNAMDDISLMNGKTVYLKWGYDFRGRVYQVGSSIRFHGGDAERASMYLPDNDELLTKEGKKWLEIAQANYYGLDKLTFDDRLKEWRLIKALAKTDADWEKIYNDADKPHQLWASLNGRNSIDLDQTASGPQFLAMGLGMKEMAVDTNVTSDIALRKQPRNDFWTIVKNAAVMDRKPAKDGFMGNLYCRSVKAMKIEIGNVEGTLLQNLFITRYKRLHAYIQYLGKMAGESARQNSPLNTPQELVTWKAPDGAILTQAGIKTVSNNYRVQWTQGGEKQRVSITLAQKELGFDAHSVGLAPNTTHGDDAWNQRVFMQLWKHAFMPTHDSYTIHANRAEEAISLINEVANIYKTKCDGGLYRERLDDLASQLGIPKFSRKFLEDKYETFKVNGRHFVC